MRDGGGRLSGKAAFVTGGTSGIGLAAARGFVRVAVTSRDRARLDVARDELGQQSLALAADVTDDAAMADAIGAAATEFGKLDVFFRLLKARQLTPARPSSWSRRRMSSRTRPRRPTSAGRPTSPI